MSPGQRQVSTMLASKPLYSLTATQVLELYKNDSITVEEYARSLLARVKERNDLIQAWTYYGQHPLSIIASDGIIAYVCLR